MKKISRTFTLVTFLLLLLPVLHLTSADSSLKGQMPTVSSALPVKGNLTTKYHCHVYGLGEITCGYYHIFSLGTTTFNRFIAWWRQGGIKTVDFIDVIFGDLYFEYDGEYNHGFYSGTILLIGFIGAISISMDRHMQLVQTFEGTAQVVIFNPAHLH